MRVLMFGWEFPPFNSGGLGTACLGLTKALSRKGTVTFVLPAGSTCTSTIWTWCSPTTADAVKAVNSLLAGYVTDTLSRADGRAPAGAREALRAGPVRGDEPLRREGAGTRQDDRPRRHPRARLALLPRGDGRSMRLRAREALSRTCTPPNSTARRTAR
jgi:hypothetical protein